MKWRDHSNAAPPSISERFSIFSDVLQVGWIEGMPESSLFGFQKLAFPLNHIPVSLSEISSNLSIGAYDSVAGDIGGEWVLPQCLTDSLRTSAANASCKLSV